MKKYISILLLSLFVTSGWAQSGNGYNPNNPADPGLYSQLNLQVSPASAGNTNWKGSKQLEQGTKVSLYASPASGYRFLRWMKGDSLLSTTSNLTYTVTTTDETLVAYFEYDPNNPADPNALGYSHRLTLYAKPSNGGYFNTSSQYLLEDHTEKVYAYPNSNYRFVSWKQNGEIISTQNPLEVTMGKEDMEYTAQFVYDPENPANPDANNFNASTGELVIDDFKAGSLTSAIYKTLGNYNYAQITRITIAGKLSASDFGFANNMTNCHTIDLARTTGYTEVPSYSFDYDTALQTIFFPYSVEKIGNYAFSGCSNLKDIYCYAVTPPIVGYNAFQNVSNELIVHVPAVSVDLYKAADGWKGHSIVAMESETCKLTVNLPNDATDGRYKNMTLVLDNITSGQTTRLLITDRTKYEIYLVPYTKYNVYVKNTNSATLGSINEIEVKDKDVEVFFTSLKQPQTVTLSVINFKGEDMTTKLDISWYDEDGKYIGVGNKVDGYVEGYKLRYHIKLSDVTALSYASPKDSTITVAKANNNFRLALDTIRLITIKGCVKNINSKQPICDANVTITQQTNGKQKRAVVAQTDNKGVFTAQIFNSSINISCSATEYVNSNLEISNFAVVNDCATIEDILLSSVVGDRVNILLTYQESVLETETAEIQNWYGDYSNIEYSIFNLTTNREITTINNRYLQLVWTEGVQVGDSLRLTANSKKNAFEPVVVKCKVDSTETTDVTFAIKQLGGITASYQTTRNENSVGMLYDANGLLQLISDYSDDQTVTFKDLRDGSYTLVSMGKKNAYNAINRLERFAGAGLLNGTDYAQNKINVESGVIKSIVLDSIPYFNESKFKTINLDKSYVSVNNSSIVAGNVLTFTTNVELQNNVSLSDGTCLIVDLPSSASFVEGSVMIGNQIVKNYTLSQNTLTIPISYVNGNNRVKFCIIPTESGQYTQSAFVRFNAEEETVIIPIGSARYEVKQVSIFVPSVICKKDIAVSGTAAPNATISVYDGDVLIGQTIANADGKWNANCNLNEPYNLSAHYITANATNKNIVVSSPVVSTLYDINGIEVSMVRMYHWNPETHKNYEITFDFQNPSHNPGTYVYYIYNKKFTFTIDFTSNDTTKVKDVILYVETGMGKEVPLRASYDEGQKKWVAEGEFGDMYDGDIPVNVSVSYISDNKIILDRDQMNNCYNILSDIQKDTEELNDKIDSITNTIDDLTSSDEEWIDAYLQVAALLGIDSYDDIEFDNDSDYYSYISTLDTLADSWSLDSLLSFNIYNQLYDLPDSLKDGITINTCDGYDESLLDLNKYTQFELTDGSVIYVCISDSIYELFDFNQNIHMIKVADATTLRAGERMAWPSSFINQLKNFEKQYHSIRATITEATSSANDLLEVILDKRATEHRFYMQRLSYLGRHPSLENVDERRLCKIKIQGLNQSIKTLENGLKIVSKVANSLKLIDKLFMFADAYSHYNSLYQLYQTPKLQNCPANQQGAQSIRNKIEGEAGIMTGYYVANVAINLLSIKTIPSGLIAATETEGLSLLAVGIAVVKLVSSELISNAYERHLTKKIQLINSEINNLKCNKDDDDDDDDDDNDRNRQKSGNENAKNTIDPSGFVYEGIFDNRLEGVTTTCYYKETIEDTHGDLVDNIVKWDAEEYGQENPLITDKEGFYQWFVPAGLWQVKYEKEGYETAYSEWLPVPPPQLEVNIGLVQNLQPEVKEAHAYKDGIVMTFDKYMMPTYLNADNIKVSQNGKYVDGEVKLLDETIAHKDENVKYASRVRFVPAAPLAINKEITLVVANRVKSYAGIPMAETFTQSFDVEKEVKQIVADSVAYVPYSGSKVITIYALPADASAGKTIHAQVASDMIASIDNQDIVIGSNGKAQFTINGELPGTTGITFSIDGVYATATTIANVGESNTTYVEKPFASVSSGSLVSLGTAISLMCTTDDVSIYYTLDNTSPVTSETRTLYDQPIVINNDTYIKAVAVNNDDQYSDVAEFNYIIDATNLVEASTDYLNISKVLRDGQLLILRDGKTYNAQGGEVK